MSDCKSLGDVVKDFMEKTEIDGKKLSRTGKQCPDHHEALWEIDGNAIECSMCQQERAREDERKKIISNRLKKFLVLKFKDVKWKSIQIYDKMQAQINRELMELSYNKTPWRNIVLLGSQGTGKSMMAYLIGVGMIKRGYTVIRLKTREFFYEIENRRSHNLSITDYVRKIKQYDLIIFEEVGRTTGTKFEFDTMFSLMDDVIEEGKKMILISNLVFGPADGKRETDKKYFTDYIDEDRIRDEHSWKVFAFTWDSFRGRK